MTEQEEWRDVVGYEGHYMVSSLGRVKSLKGGQERILRPAKIGSGYLGVVLSIDGKGTGQRVHSLVAYAFLGARPPGYTINHLSESGDKTDNRAANLAYATAAENTRHSRDVLGYDNSGEKHHKSKLTTADIYTIFDMHRQNKSPDEIAQMFNVCPLTIKNVVTGKTWKHITQSAPTDGDN